MFKFSKATYLYRLRDYCNGRVEEVNTDKGRMILDKALLHCEPLVHVSSFLIAGGLVIPSYYVKKEDMLYLMKEEPVFYA